MNNGILIAGAGLGVLWYVTRGRKSTQAQIEQQQANKTNTVKSPLNWLPTTGITTFKFAPGNAIGDYTGLTQDQANQKAIHDANDQFISPWTTGYGVYKK